MKINVHLKSPTTTARLALTIRHTILCGLFLGLGLGSSLYANPPAPPTTASLTLTDWLNRGISYMGTVVDTDKSRAYVAMDRTADNDLAVFDFSSQALVHLGTVKGFGNNLFRHGKLLGSIQQDSGLVLWDMTIPMAPRQVATLSGVGQGYYNHSIVEGNRLYNNFYGTISVIDLGTPETPNPQRLTSFQAAGIDEFVLAGGYLFGIGQYLGTYTLSVYDVRKIAQISKVAELQFEAPRLNYYNGGAVLALLRNNRFLVISNRGENAIHVIDVANPLTPKRLVSYEDTSGLPSSGRFSNMTKTDNDRFLMVSEYYGVSSFRISTSGVVLPESSLVSVPSAYAVDAAGSFGFVTGWHDDLTLLNLARPYQPTVIASSDPHPSSPEILVDGRDVYTSRDNYQFVSDSGKLLPVTLNLTVMPLAVQDRILLIKKDGKLSLCRRLLNNTLKTIGSIPLDYASEAEFCGPLLRVFSAGKSYLYDCKTPSNPVYLGQISATAEIGSFPGCVNRDQALFSNFLAIRDAAGFVKIYDAYNLAKGPIQRVSNSGHLSRSRDLLFCKTPEGLKIIRSGPGRTVVVKNFPELGPFSTWNISADSQTMAVWVASQAKLFQIMRESDYGISIKELGTDAIPACLCHGGWYGRVVDNFLFTNDTFAGISVLRMNNLPAPVLIPEIVVEQPVGSSLVDSMSKKNFGTLALGLTGTAKVFTIKNTGTSDLKDLAIAKNGDHAPDFVISALADTTLAPGSTTTFKVSFKPTASGIRSAAIHIKSNDMDENSFGVSLAGIGVSN